MVVFIRMIKAIFWDFDGVIADSVNVKTDAFYELYLPYGKDIAEKVKTYHLANGGVSRFKKFEYWQTELLGNPSPVPQEVIDDLASRFSSLVMEKVINAPYIEGVFNILVKYSSLVSNFIISGTPEDEMKAIIEGRGLTQYFKDVLGSPETKEELTSKLMKREGLDSREVIFIGDALSDLHAAQNNNTWFILRKHKDNIDLFKDYRSFVIDDFTHFDEVFELINNA